MFLLGLPHSKFAVQLLRKILAWQAGCSGQANMGRTRPRQNRFLPIERRNEQPSLQWEKYKTTLDNYGCMRDLEKSALQN